MKKRAAEELANCFHGDYMSVVRSAGLRDEPTWMQEQRSQKATRLRQEHRSDERAVRAVGYAYLLAAIGLGFGVLIVFTGGNGTSASEPDLGIQMMFSALFVLTLTIMVGLFQFRPWVCWPVGFFAVIGLLGFPFGTLLNAGVLWTIHGRPGKTVFSPEYQDALRMRAYRVPAEPGERGGIFDRVTMALLTIFGALIAFIVWGLIKLA